MSKLLELEKHSLSQCLLEFAETITMLTGVTKSQC